jgi:tetratricopeptide (TPR) repeat protein
MSLVKTARCYYLPLAFALCVTCGSSHAQELRALEPGKPVERRIAGGETHTYSLKLKAGQFIRVIVEQKHIDLVVALTAPDGKQLGEANFTGAGGMESFSHEAALSGGYRIAIRTVNAAAPKGSYLLRVEVKAETTPDDKKQIAAERLLAEAIRLNQQGPAAFNQIVEKAQQALALWRELDEPYWEASTLGRLGGAYSAIRSYDQAIEYYNQALKSAAR